MPTDAGGGAAFRTRQRWRVWADTPPRRPNERRGQGWPASPPPFAGGHVPALPGAEMRWMAARGGDTFLLPFNPQLPRNAAYSPHPLSTATGMGGEGRGRRARCPPNPGRGWPGPGSGFSRGHDDAWPGRPYSAAGSDPDRRRRAPCWSGDGLICMAIDNPQAG